MSDQFTFLLPTDYSTFSLAAFRQAQALALQYQARLIVLHVIPSTTGRKNKIVFRVDPVSAIQPSFAGRRGDGTPIDRRIEQGDPATAILNVASEEHVDMIIMVDHNSVGSERSIGGGIVENVIQLAECPVLVFNAARISEWGSTDRSERIPPNFQWSGQVGESCGKQRLERKT